MKVNVTKTETTISIVELSFPCFIKSKAGYHLYKMKSENEIIQIFEGIPTYTNFYHSSITNVPMDIALQDGWEFTTEEEFNEWSTKILKSFAL